MRAIAVIKVPCQRMISERRTFVSLVIDNVHLSSAYAWAVTKVIGHPYFFCPVHYT